MIFIGLFSFCTAAEVHVKEKLHYDSTYLYGRATEGGDLTIQWWFSDRQVAADIVAFRIVLDKKAQHILVINNRQKTYIQIPLPLKPAAHLDKEASRTLAAYKIEGKVKKQEKKKKIHQKECQLYVIDEKTCDLGDTPTYENKCFYDREQKVWMTTDITFNWQLKNELIQTLRLFFNPRESYLTDFKGLKGWGYAAKYTMFMRAAKFTYSAETVEISEKEAPKGTFAIPADFKKKQVFKFAEIRQILAQLYWRAL